MSLAPLKICDWLLNSSWDHCSLHRGNICKSDHGARGPPKALFSSLRYPLSWYNMFCGGRGIKGSLATKVKGPQQRKIEIEEEEEEEER